MGHSARQQHSCSFDHLVGLGEQRGRHVEAERLCGLEVENKAKAGRLLERQFSGNRSFENGVYEGCQTVETLIQIRTIRHQAAVADEEVELIDGWESMHCREIVNAPAVEVGEYIRDHEGWASSPPTPRSVFASRHDQTLSKRLQPLPYGSSEPPGYCSDHDALTVGAAASARRRRSAGVSGSCGARRCGCTAIRLCLPGNPLSTIGTTFAGGTSALGDGALASDTPATFSAPDTRSPSTPGPVCVAGPPARDRRSSPRSFSLAHSSMAQRLRNAESRSR